MANRLKTIEYWFNSVASVPDNTEVGPATITLDIPDAIASNAFRSVYLEVMIQDAEATANNINRRQLSLQLGSAGYSVINNTNLLTASSEQKTLMHSGNFTSYFNTNWSGTSMTCDARILFDNAIATPVQLWRGATFRLVITYLYDDTSVTQVKTVRIHLKTPSTTLPGAKGSPLDTIPALDTFCPEDSKSFKQIHIVVEGNTESASTGDYVMNWEVDSLGVFTSPTMEGALNTAVWFRFNQLQTFTTNATHSFYMWGTNTAFPHPLGYLVVTYTYNDSTSTSILNSILLPMSIEGQAGGTTNTNFQRAKTTLWIEEPSTIAIQKSGVAVFYDQLNPITGMQLKVNSGAYTYTFGSQAATNSGGCVLTMECEAYITLVRGPNVLQLDIYRTDADDYMANVCAVWMINYTSAKSSQGSGAHNKTVIHNFNTVGTVTAEKQIDVASVALVIPESDYFWNNISVWMVYNTNTSGQVIHNMVAAQRLVAEGGSKWEYFVRDPVWTDSLTGIRNGIGDSKFFKRFKDDYDPERIDVQTARTYRSDFAPALGWRTLNLIATYHSIVFSVAGNITDSNGGTVNIALFSEYDKVIKKATTRSGNGSYSFSWYDNTQKVWVDAYEDDNHLGRSASGYASGTP